MNVFKYDGEILLVRVGNQVHEIMLTDDLLAMDGRSIISLLVMQLNGVFSTSANLSITEAADILSVHPSTLRQWEKDGKITPSKTSGGHRRYTIENLNTITKEKV